VGTAPLKALKGLALTRCSLETLPPLDCLSRLEHLALSHNRFPVRPIQCTPLLSCVQKPQLETGYARGHPVKPHECR
jgi:hypothetical protein